MGRRAVVPCAGVLLLLVLLPGPALAAATLDQSNTVTGARWAGAATRAQTFTVGKTGTLTRVDLVLGETVPAPVTVKIESLDRSTGLPTGTVLSQASVTVGSAPWFEFDLGSPQSFLANAHLAIVFTLDTNGYVAGSSNNAYTRGQALVAGRAGWAATGSGTDDYDFKTYVQAPVATPVPTAAPTPTLAPTPTATPTLASIASTSPSPLATVSSGPTGPAVSATPTATATSGPASAPASGPASGPASNPASGPASGLGGFLELALPIVVAGSVVLGLVLGGLWFILGMKQRPSI